MDTATCGSNASAVAPHESTGSDGPDLLVNAGTGGRMSANDEASQFTVFGKLPYELRLMIWEMALAEESSCRTVLFDILPSLGTIKGPGSPWTIYPTKEMASAFLRVNQESRALALKHYPYKLNVYHYNQDAVGSMGSLASFTHKDADKRGALYLRFKDDAFAMDIPILIRHQTYSQDALLSDEPSIPMSFAAFLPHEDLSLVHNITLFTGRARRLMFHLATTIFKDFKTFSTLRRCATKPEASTFMNDPGRFWRHLIVYGTQGTLLSWKRRGYVYCSEERKPGDAFI
ncbi:uncharacterized protein JN550_005262 [Neoarthrinium moseri]|uniref:uncharacterized protein n=1 Tax=Neoarthrinium moseri TaxID=1658444 RepID=UPI001FDB8D70|nr:uncharacterized protein JN550_005262 [Neoarthrinium moseri]KAI1870334.1 hypothetical protein JN550_005262 [Neoarthrinium moseri]